MTFSITADADAFLGQAETVTGGLDRQAARHWRGSMIAGHVKAF